MLAVCLLVYVGANTVGLLTLFGLMVGELLPLRARGIGGGCIFFTFNLLLFFMTKFSMGLPRVKYYIINSKVSICLYMKFRIFCIFLDLSKYHIMIDMLNILKVSSLVSITRIFTIFGIFSFLEAIFIYHLPCFTRNEELHASRD